VHEIANWDKLRDRLEPGDRRCFAFFHPALADEPLIFVEVALTATSSDAIAPLLADERQPIQAANARTAVFYSISNCQAGLRGVAFGHFLIKQVVEELKREFQGLDRFVTLSPVPDFARWLAGQRASPSTFLSAADKAELTQLDQPGWHNSRDVGKTLRPVVQAAIAHYFLLAKTDSGKPIDSVARFHLNNGARLERVNWLADVSAKGLAAAHGFMVNYLYDVDAIERNHEAFANDGVVMAAHRVKRLLERRPAADQTTQ
jgi:malonyl-CoA decarboxylase